MMQPLDNDNLTLTARALAHPNIAFIKYWGNRDAHFRIPLSGSVSMNLDGLETETRVCFNPKLAQDLFRLNGELQSGEPAGRVSRFLDYVRQKAGVETAAIVESSNNFPAGAGIASSAAAFAALALAASSAIGLDLTEEELSRLARLGSGSACRSIPGGFVEWLPGSSDLDSYAVSIANQKHWQLIDLVAVLDASHKVVGSSSGHALAETSPLNSVRLAGVDERLTKCKKAILERDFELLAAVTELDAQWMHAVMRTSEPQLRYWAYGTEIVMWNVLEWRRKGHAACTTIDAGPNVHVIALESELDWLQKALQELPGVKEVLVARPGGGAHLI